MKSVALRTLSIASLGLVGSFALGMKYVPSVLARRTVESRRDVDHAVVLGPGGPVAPLTIAPPIPPSHEIRAARPSALHVWTDGEFAWDGARFVWLAGRWATPPTDDATWIAGRWLRADDRWRMAPGHWLGASEDEPPDAADPIALGATIIDTLDPSDRPSSASDVHRDFALYVRARESIRAIATSEPSFAPRPTFAWDVTLFERGLVRARGDDGAGSGERELAWTAGDDGVLVVRVFARDATGPLPYRLTVAPDEPSSRGGGPNESSTGAWP